MDRETTETAEASAAGEANEAGEIGEAGKVNEPGELFIFFMRCPERSKMKKRLATHLDDDFIMKLYKNFIEDHLDTLEELGKPYWIAPNIQRSREQCHSWLGSHHTFIEQIGESQGQRLANCFSQAFEKGIQRVILLGSDLPDLPASLLEQALAHLHEKDCVLGPSFDGGYNLIGFSARGFTPQAFVGPSWGTGTVLEDTLTTLRHEQKRVALLPQWNDNDHFSDLLELIQRNRDTPFANSRTIRCLLENDTVREALKRD